MSSCEQRPTQNDEQTGVQYSLSCFGGLSLGLLYPGGVINSSNTARKSIKEHHRTWSGLGWKAPLRIFNSRPLSWAGKPSTTPGCSSPMAGASECWLHDLTPCVKLGWRHLGILSMSEGRWMTSENTWRRGNVMVYTLCVTKKDRGASRVQSHPPAERLKACAKVRLSM